MKSYKKIFQKILSLRALAPSVLKKIPGINLVNYKIKTPKDFIYFTEENRDEYSILKSSLNINNPFYKREFNKFLSMINLSEEGFWKELEKIGIILPFEYDSKKEIFQFSLKDGYQKQFQFQEYNEFTNGIDQFSIRNILEHRIHDYFIEIYKKHGGTDFKVILNNFGETEFIFNERTSTFSIMNPVYFHIMTETQHSDPHLNYFMTIFLEMEYSKIYFPEKSRSINIKEFKSYLYFMEKVLNKEIDIAGTLNFIKSFDEVKIEDKIYILNKPVELDILWKKIDYSKLEELKEKNIILNPYLLAYSKVINLFDNPFHYPERFIKLKESQDE